MINERLASLPVDEFDDAESRYVARREEDAYHERGIVLIRLDSEQNPLRKRLAADLAFSRFGPRKPKGRKS